MEPADVTSKDHPSKALLTDEELSALTDVRSKQGGSGGGNEKKLRIQPYDFRRPDRVSKEQIRSLYLLHDAFARNLSGSLPNFLRAVSEVTLVSVEQRAYFDYLSGLPDPAALFLITMSPLEGMAILEVSPSIAFSVVDRQLGGSGVPITESRALTDIEQSILESFIKIVGDALQEAWNPIVAITFECVGCETCPKLLQIVSPNEVVLSMSFHVRVDDVRGTINLCIPAPNIEPVLPNLKESSYSRMNPDVPPSQTRAILDCMASAQFPIAAELRGNTATIRDLLRLTEGDVLRLDRKLTDPVEVSVGEIVKFRGDLAAKEGHTVIIIRESLIHDGKATPNG